MVFLFSFSGGPVAGALVVKVLLLVLLVVFAFLLPFDFQRKKTLRKAMSPIAASSSHASTTLLLQATMAPGSSTYSTQRAPLGGRCLWHLEPNIAELNDLRTNLAILQISSAPEFGTTVVHFATTEEKAGCVLINE